MNYKTQPTTSRLHKKIMNFAKTLEFKTGNPLRVYKIHLDGTKLKVVTFMTERGVEEFYNDMDCLATAMEASDTLIRFTK